METFQDRLPLSLIACADDWMSRALESVFQQHGYVVAHTRSGAQTMELARLANHDLLVLDESLIDVKAIDVCLRRYRLRRYSNPPQLVSSPVLFETWKAVEREQESLVNDL